MSTASQSALTEEPDVPNHTANDTAHDASGDTRALSTEDRVQAAATAALAKKGGDLIILDVAERTSFADYFLIVSAPSERQAGAIAHHIENELRRIGVRPLGVEGGGEQTWVLLDYGDVVIHVFLDSARGYYDLEGFWVDAPRLEVDEKRGEQLLAI